MAAAIESDPRTDPGKVLVWDTRDLTVKVIVTVGSLPDMVTFSPDGQYIVSANEGEPNEDYTVDPNGSVSIIKVNRGFGVTTIDFSSLRGRCCLSS